MALLGSLVLGAVLFVLMIVLGVTAHPLLVGAIVLGTSIAVFCDARALGVRKLGSADQRRHKLAYNGGPGAWLAACLLFWVFMLPLYLLTRPALVSLFREGRSDPASLSDLNAPSAPAPTGPWAPAPSAAPAAPQAEYIDQLRKLAALRDEGILTTEEFERKKAALLGFDR